MAVTTHTSSQSFHYREQFRCNVPVAYGVRIFETSGHLSDVEYFAIPDIPPGNINNTYVEWDVHKCGILDLDINILPVSACFHPGFHTLNMGRVFKYSFQIRR